MLCMAMLLAAGVNAGEVPAANVIAPAAEKGVPARWGSAESVQAKISLKREQNAQQQPKKSVAELTAGQVTSATSVSYVSHNWNAPRDDTRDDTNFGSLPITREDVMDSLTDSKKGNNSKPKNPLLHTLSSKTRCGFFWDDAAVKCGKECTGKTFGECSNAGDCYADLPQCDHNYPAGRCFGVQPGVSDAWCVQTSQTIDETRQPLAEEEFYKNCICEEVVVGPNTPTEEAPLKRNISDMPQKSEGLMNLVKEVAKNFPGLPDCTWRPAKVCTNVTQYECMEGPKAGMCSGDNWYYRPTECTASCVHSSVLTPAPYYAVWRSGPRALPWKKDAMLPHYVPKNSRSGDEVTKNAINAPKQILMSEYCKSAQIEFVGVSLFSPAYEEKARRLLDSCNRVGVCCKATEVYADYLGPNAPEGSDEFRYRTISAKPIFLLDQLEKTKEPVVFLDVDLEFHRYPQLFLPGSWTEGPRDVALFNFWANETKIKYRHTPNIGSAVAFFNHTYRAKKLLTAWAEAMRYGTNQKAPDDQVLDTLFNQGGWLARVSLGWLPAAYLRTMPAYYRGVQAVIDHDHGTAPGVQGHSTVKPKLPPTLWNEPVDPNESWD